MRKATLERRLPRRPAAALVAREAGGTLLPHEAPPEAAHDLALVVTELVANAVAHGHGRRLRLAVRADAERALVEVTSRGRGVTAAGRPASPEAESGRGLALVSALSERWGVQEGPLGTSRVWAEVPLQRSAV